MTAFVPLSARAGNEGQNPALDLASVVWSPRFLGAGEYPYTATNKAAQFHASASLWVYAATNASAAIADLAAWTPIVGVAMNPSSLTQSSAALQEDFTTGQNMKASWYTWTGGWWGCVNRSLFRSAISASLAAWFGMGVRHIQFDDPESNHTLARGLQFYRGTGNVVGTLTSGGIGCFCSECQARSLAIGNGTLTAGNMTEFQKNSATNFWQWLGDQVHATAGAKISANLHHDQNLFDRGYTAGRFDIPLVEWYAPDTTGDAMIDGWTDYSGHLIATLAVNTQSSYEQAFAASDRTRRWMAASYALGLHPVLPWDVYAGGGPRVFAARADVADLSGFVRAAGSDVLSGYSLAGALGESRIIPSGMPSSAWASVNSVLVTVRYRATDGRRVIHVVDMRDTPASLTLSWWSPVVGAGAVTVREPAPYNATTHDAAIASGNRSTLAVLSSPAVSTAGLVRSISLGAGLWRIVEVAP